MPFRYSDVYDENKHKHIEAKLPNLPLDKSEQIVRGLIHADDCVHDEIVFESTSSKLIESLRYILLRMGILRGGYIRDRIGESYETVRGCV